MGLLGRNKYKKVENVPAIAQAQPVPAQSVQQEPSKELQAVIIAAEVGADGEYYYRVVTNFPLNLGGCSITN